MRSDLEPSYRRSTGLVDVLDRVLDKGLVVAGDIRISLAEVELITIRVRLLVCSIDKAEAIGLDWWKRDPYMRGESDQLQRENIDLRGRVKALEARLNALASGGRRAQVATKKLRRKP